MTEPRTLPAMETIAESFRFLFENRNDALRLAFVPFLVFLALHRLDDYLEPDGWAELPWTIITLIAYSVPATWLLVPWYRRVLAREAVGTDIALPVQTRFLKYWVGLEIFPLMVWLPVVIGNILSQAGDAEPDPRLEALTLLSLALVPPVIYVYMRIYLAAPAAAVGKEGGIIRSWLATMGNGWTIFAVQMMWYAPMFPLVMVASLLAAEDAPPTQGFVGSILLSVFFVLTELIFATVFAHIYKRLDPAARENPPAN